jgi:hypothetical protein
MMKVSLVMSSTGISDIWSDCTVGSATPVTGSTGLRTTLCGCLYAGRVDERVDCGTAAWYSTCMDVCSSCSGGRAL